MNNKVIVRMRREMTLRYSHIVISGECCLYCRHPVNPKRYANGKTQHLDHFMLVRLLVVIATRYPSVQIERTARIAMTGVALRPDRPTWTQFWVIIYLTQ